MEHLVLLAGLNDTKQCAVTLVLSPNPIQSVHKSLLITIQRSTILVMDDESGQSCTKCMMLSGAHRSDSVVHDRGHKFLDINTRMFSSTGLSANITAQHTPDLSLSAASVASDAAALLPCTANDVSAITQCAYIPACHAQGNAGIACLCLSKQDTACTDDLTGNTQDGCASQHETL